MAKGRTLWEMFVDWTKGPRELRQFNPLKAKIGGGLVIDDIEWRDRNFLIREIRVYSRRIEGQEFLFADYQATERSTKGDETTVRVRLNPTADAQYSGIPHHALLLSLEDDLAYDEDLHAVVKDTTKKFQILQDGKVTAEFTRAHDLTEPYHAEVTVLADEDHNKRIDRDEVKTAKLDYWDYCRDVPDAAGQPEKEYLFVEMDAGTGWFQIWRGKEIDPRKVSIM
jgi:hypothetical protein